MSMASWRAADALAPSVAVASVFRASRRSSAGVAGEPSFATAAGSLAAGEKGLARSWTRLGPITAGGAAAVPAAPAGEARARRARAPTAKAAPARRDRPGNLPLVAESLRLTCPTRSGADRLVARLVEARSATFGKPLGRAPGRAAVPGSSELPTWGTPSTWSLLSVKKGPSWHSTQPTLLNSFWPSRAWADMVPLSKAVGGGPSVLT